MLSRRNFFAASGAAIAAAALPCSEVGAAIKTTGRPLTFTVFRRVGTVRKRNGGWADIFYGYQVDGGDTVAARTIHYDKNGKQTALITDWRK